MSLYDDVSYAVRGEAEQAHQAALDSFSQPGTWLTAAERADIVDEVRRARVEAGVQEDDATEVNPVSPAELPDGVRAIAREIAVSPKNIGRDFYDAAVPAQLTDAEYVELVSVVARAVGLDIFARGIGAPMRKIGAALPEEPTYLRPGSTADGVAFVPLIPDGKAGGEEGAALYGGRGMTPNILRATSLVPDECRGVYDLNEAQYIPFDSLMDFGFSYEPPTIDRPQIELVAGRISALNDCFY
jgi:hypothetical protein